MNNSCYYFNEKDADTAGERMQAIATKVHPNETVNLTIFADGKILFRKGVRIEFLFDEDGTPLSEKIEGDEVLPLDPRETTKKAVDTTGKDAKKPAK